MYVDFCLYEWQNLVCWLQYTYYMQYMEPALYLFDNVEQNCAGTKQQLFQSHSLAVLGTRSRISTERAGGANIVIDLSTLYLCTVSHHVSTRQFLSERAHIAVCTEQIYVGFSIFALFLVFVSFTCSYLFLLSSLSSQHYFVLEQLNNSTIIQFSIQIVQEVNS